MPELRHVKNFFSFNFYFKGVIYLKVLSKTRMEWDEFLEEIVLNIKQTSLPKVVWKGNEQISFYELEHFIVDKQGQWRIVYFDCMIRALPNRNRKRSFFVEIWF